MGAFDGLDELLFLFLNSIAITSIHRDTFDGLTNLQIPLICNRNSVASLDADELFDGTHGPVLTLYLHGNSIASLDADTFEGLTALNQSSLWMLQQPQNAPCRPISSMASRP